MILCLVMTIEIVLSATDPVVSIKNESDLWLIGNSAMSQTSDAPEFILGVVRAS